MAKRDFLSLLDFSKAELSTLISRAIELKEERARNIIHNPLKGKTGILLLQQNSTRTRIAFEAGMTQLGGHSIFLSDQDSQASRGEPLEDFARVASQMADVIMTRRPKHEDIELLAKHSTIPVINGMSSLLHPCQLLADMQTFAELHGPIKDKSVAFIGDGYNMCNSYINAAIQLDFSLSIATPVGYEPNGLATVPDNARIAHSQDPIEAVAGASLVVTDVWASMGQESESDQRNEKFRGYQVNDELLAHAVGDVLFMHCLPAHRGEEVSAAVIDGQQSRVWDEAENRLHAQKALLELLLARG